MFMRQAVTTHATVRVSTDMSTQAASIPMRYHRSILLHPTEISVIITLIGAYRMITCAKVRAE